MTPITAQQIDALLPFLDTFEADGFSAGGWSSKPGYFPCFMFDRRVLDFIQVLYENGWVAPFDWPEWQESAFRYVESPERVDSADATTIQKLLTTHVRKNRFCDGHLAEMIENGHVVALLRRLRYIRKEMTD
jgi:hypothetical protein